VHRIGKIFGWLIASLLILVLLVPVLLYIPFVQDFAVGLATRKVSEATGMQIGVGKLRLGFPLKLSVEDVEVIQADRDTMLTASRASVRVALMPLLRKEIEVRDIELDTAFYQMGNADSLMWLRANVEKGAIDAVDLNFNFDKIDLSRADIDGVKVRLRMLPDTTEVPADTAKSAPMAITAGLINISRVDFGMEMRPTIDSLSCLVETASLRDAVVDMGTRTISGRSLAIDSVTAAYFYPAVTAETPAENSSEAEEAPTPESEMWTVTADTLSLTARSGLYAQTGAKPAEGFDPAYIGVTDVKIKVDSFYNRGTSIRVPLKTLDARERCGLTLHADGLFTMDPKEMKATAFNIETLRSILRLDALMGMGDLTADNNLPLTLKTNGRIDPSDILLAFPDFRSMLAPLRPLSLSADIDGTSGQLNVYSLRMDMPSIFRMYATGTVDHPFQSDKLGGSLTLDGWLNSVSDKQFAFLPIAHVPALSLNGNFDYSPGQAAGNIEVTTGGGRVAAEGSWTARTEDYDADIALSSFPVQTFMPELGLGPVTGHISLDGRGYNPMAKSTSVDAKVRIDQAVYKDEKYSAITLDATLHGGLASGHLLSHNPGADLSMDFDGTLDRDTIRYDLTADLRDINLRSLHLTDSLNAGHGVVKSAGYYNIATQAMDIDLGLSEFYWSLPGMTIAPAAPLSLQLESATATVPGTDATLKNGNLSLHFGAEDKLLTFVDSITPAMAMIQQQVDSMRINVREINRAIPRFAMDFTMGRDNVVYDILRASDIDFRGINGWLRNDSLISFDVNLSKLSVGSTRTDSITLSGHQRGDYLLYRATMDNKPGTFDDFAHVLLRGFVGFNRANVFLTQHNIKNEQGFNIGLNASIIDSVVSVHLVPRRPTIAYKDWSLNDSNYISYDLADRHVDANLRLASGDSYIKVFTPQHTDSLGIASVHHHGEGQEDVIVQIANVKLQDWLSINPFAPPIKGDLSADIHVQYHDPLITGTGTIGLADLYYGKERVGTFDLGVDVSSTLAGKLMADVSLMVDSVKTVTARGVLNDSTQTSPFLLDFNMIKFPLAVANPFLPSGTSKLRGVLNGAMTITGDMAAPMFNGYLEFDSAAVTASMLGTEFKFPAEKIPVDSNIITFKDFAITACNANPLTINGTVDVRHLSNVALDLDLNARNMQIVKSDRPRGADVYGKAFIDLDAKAHGNMQRIVVDADVALLSGSNVTYVLSTSTSELTSSANNDMVKFVNFADTAQVETADSVPPAMLMWVNADISIQEGTTVNVDLNTNGSNRVQIKGNGDLDFSMSPLNGMRMTGRLNIDGGFARYSIPPVLSEKNFAFEDGSYVAFNGDVMNPVLNVKGVDVLKANVTQSGSNSRLVNFDVLLSVTGTLSSMNVAFDLRTNDDITVQNELTSMSSEQRANQAMNLLLYGQYTGAGTKGSANLSGNPLFSLLTSQLNSWAANSIKGVDISFGIDQYDSTREGSTSTTTSYSYRVSKSLFNDRFKIVVGGRYSTDANADENFSQNLINDISFEYMLNKSGSMYIRVFRHTGYESILEGEITQTGVGFVLRRKLNSLFELIGIRRD